MPCSRGVCSWGCLLRGGSARGGGGEPPPRKQTATVADGTHPTGMHSCLNLRILYFVTGLHQIKKSFLSFANLISRIFLTSNFPVSKPENDTKLTW